MVQKADGMMYAPKGKAKPVVKKGEFPFAAMRLDHGHIYGMCNGLTEAGGDLRLVYDPDPAKVKAFQEQLSRRPRGCVRGRGARRQGDPPRRGRRDPERARPARLPRDGGGQGLLLRQDAVHGEGAPRGRAPRREEDRPQVHGLLQRAAARGSGDRGRRPDRRRRDRPGDPGASASARTGSTRPTRPAWFFKKKQYGGILCDIGSHQIEQFLFYTGAKDAKVVHAKVANYHNPQYPELEDFGDASLVADNGATSYFRVRLVHARRAFDVGRRAALHPRHQRLHGDPQVRERRDGQVGRSPLPRQRQGRAAPGARGQGRASRSSAS